MAARLLELEGMYQSGSAHPQRLYLQLAGLLSAQSSGVPGMEPPRADVIAGGVAIYERIMKLTNAPVLVTCDRGIRWGLAFTLAGH